MQKTGYIFGLAAIALGFASAGPCFGADTSTQRDLSLEPCHRCHMPGAEKNEPSIPLVYGQPRSYLRHVLSQFKKGERASEVMAGVTRQHTDKELDRFSELMATHERVRITQSTDSEKANKGRAIYRERCAECHADEGRDSEFDAPYLAGQPLEYLRRQISFIRQGDRKVHYMMREVYVGLKQEDLDALAHFFASRE